MAREFEYQHLPASAGRGQVQYPGGWILHAEIMGYHRTLSAEGVAAAGPATITLKEPVRVIFVTAANPVFVAKEPAALAAPGAGEEDARIYVPANTPTELPWYQDEVSFQAVGAGGAVYIRGMI